MDYEYWVIEYLSCGSNDRWVIARTPSDWNESDLEGAITLGGVGDDIAEIRSIYTTSDDDYTLDYT